MYSLWIANKNYSSWSLRPWLLLKALDVPFKENQAFFNDSASSYNNFRQFSPTGLVPCLIDQSTIVWDSLAICEYIAEDFPNAWPTDRAARAWSRSACAEMHSSFQFLRTQCPMNCNLRTQADLTNSNLQQDLQRLEELWSEGLERFGGPWLAGKSFSIVDAFFAPVVLRIQSYNLPLSEHCHAWYERILHRPATQAWLTAAAQEPQINH